MKLNNKGFIISALIYSVLILFVILSFVLIYTVNSSTKKREIYSNGITSESNIQTKINLIEPKIITSIESYDVLNDGEYYLKRIEGTNETLLCKIYLEKGDEIKLDASNNFVINSNTSEKLCKINNYNSLEQIKIDSYIFLGDTDNLVPTGGSNADSKSAFIEFASKLSCDDCVDYENGLTVTYRPNSIIIVKWDDIKEDGKSKYDRYFLKVYKLSSDGTYIFLESSLRTTIRNKYLYDNSKIGLRYSIDKFFVEVYGVTPENVVEGITKSSPKNIYNLKKDYES